MKSPEELLPCPFCGGEAELDDSLAQWDHAVQCRECHASTYLWDSDAEAIKYWNCRANRKKGFTDGP